MKSHRFSARRYAVCGLFVLLAALSRETALASPPPFTPLAEPCVSSSTTLCLNNQRFKLDVQWKDFQGNTGVGQAVPLTSDTGYFWFFANTNVELVVKVLDGRGLNNHFWVFFGALSNVEYTMRVTDTVTGSVKTYFNPSGRFASVGDTEAFSASGSVGSAYVEGNDGSMVTSRFTPGESPEHALALHSTANDNALAQALTTCVGTETSLCLNNGRFRVAVTWKDFAGNTGVGKAISLTPETGYFWFFSSTNVELVVKVLDARGLGNRFWVFYGALSNVEYEMTVTDTLTGNVSTYSNPSGRFASTGDTNAFRAGYSVAARLDQSRAVSRDIPTTGGSISATAGDGTVFTLTVPRDALLSEERITMTPVAAIDGLPLSGGLAGAVDLAPAGLRLFQAATLTIAPAAAIPIAEEITFAWRGNGEEFFLYPPELGTSTISMKLMHFSGYGVGRGTAADQAAQQQRVPASPEDALSQRLQDLFAKKRTGQSIGLVALVEPDPDFNAKVEAELRAYYNSVLAPEVEAAKRDCEKGKAIFARAIAWARSPLLIGLGDKFASEIDNIMSARVDWLANCYNESFDKCVSKHDPAQVQPLLAFFRQLALVGADGRVDPAKIDRCARFELTFESDIKETPPVFGQSWRHQVRAIVPLTFSFETGPTGNADLVYSVTYIGMSVDPCSLATVGTNSVFNVLKTSIDLNAFEANAPPPQPLTMAYDPGSPNQKDTLTCPMQPPLVLEGQRWTNYYEHHHGGERSGSAFLARDWSPVGGEIYARKTYQITSSAAVETTTLTLKHTPQ